ncbi:MAG: T9SS type A sorting domain-containing protein [Prevotella sp.]|nr:T9SS type A sorting domain-containing protein [Prevotella sp.]
MLKGEPGQTYTFDRIPEPKRLTITNSDGVKTYNALLCEIFGFYPESEILYMYGNYEYGEGFYKVNDWYQPSGNYLTVAIAGGTPPVYFTLDATPTGIEDIEDGRLNDENESSDIYDLQGRKLSSSNSQLSTLPKGLYIKDGKKIVKK